jgi:HD-GYP domain-containing protein (c-di-GMP phosphodiesterase class II)
MTKYIDLLREHQQEPKKTKKGKKSKRAKASASKQNPYSAKQACDETLSENMEALIEEQEKDVAQQDMVTEESISPKSDNQHSQAEHMPSPAQKMTTDYGFDISAWLNNINQTLLRMFTAVQNDETINLDMLHEQLSTLFDQVQTSPKLLDVLELEINSQHKRNSGTHAHADLAQKSIMMMLYSIKVGMQFKLQWEELLPIVVAAMLHHLGMAFVPSHIRQKPEKLTNEEFEHIKQASKHALEYLEKHHINHEQLYLAISQGNERYDGSGPQELEGHDIAWVARLVSLLSTFEAMIHFRPYRQRLLPLDAIREIVKNHKKEFDPELLKALIDSISLYPVGTFVQLNTGEIGQVTTVHPKFPLRPVVYINMNKHGHAISQREIDLKKQPNLMIQKCMYEESIQELTEEQTSS